MKFFIDENLPPNLAEGLHLLEKPNGDGIEIISIQKEFGRGAKDEDWLPMVGKQGGIVLTQDLRIHSLRSQKEIYRAAGVGIFFFHPPSNSGWRYWEMVLQIINRWAEIKKIEPKNQHPFCLSMHRPQQKF